MVTFRPRNIFFIFYLLIFLVSLFEIGTFFALDEPIKLLGLGYPILELAGFILDTIHFNLYEQMAELHKPKVQLALTAIAIVLIFGAILIFNAFIRITQNILTGDILLKPTLRRIKSILVLLILLHILILLSVFDNNMFSFLGEDGEVTAWNLMTGIEYVLWISLFFFSIKWINEFRVQSQKQPDSPESQ